MAIKVGELIYELGLEDKQFQTDMKSSEKRMSGLGDKARKLGSTMSKTVTPALLAAGGASVKFASDLEESMNAVNVVFEESSNQIINFGETAAEQVGLSQAKFQQLSVSTGALLKNAGLENFAADTIDVTKRAADLASVFNEDVDVALNAFQAGLRGETEPLRRFGVNINQAAIESEALSMGLIESGEQMTEQQKIAARLNLIMQQSADVQGDFTNTSDSLANSTRILKAQLVDMGADIGEELIPLVTDIVSDIRDWVSWFSELDDGTKETIVRIAGLTAIIGPAITAIGGITRAVKVLNTTALFGPAGLIVGLGLAVGALIKLDDHLNEKHVERLAEEYGELGERISKTGEVTDEFLKKIEGIEQAFGRNIHADFESVKTQTKQLAKNLGVSESQVVAIGLASKDVSDAVKEQLKTIKKQVDEEDALRAYREGQIASSEKIKELKERQRDETAGTADEEARITDEQQRQQDYLDRINEIAAERRESIREEYGYKLDLLDTEGEIEKIELDRQRTIEDAKKDYVETGKEVQLINDYYDELIEKTKEAKKAEEERLEKEKIKERYEFEMQYQDDTLENRLDNLEKEYQEALSRAEELGADKKAVEEWFINEKSKLVDEQAEKEKELAEEQAKKQKELAEEARQQVISVISYVNSALGLVSELGSTAAGTLEEQAQEAEKEGDTEQAEELTKAQKGIQQSTDLIVGMGEAAAAFATGNYVEGAVKALSTFFAPVLERVSDIFTDNPELVEGFARIGEFFARVAENLMPIIIELLEIFLELMEPFLPLLEILTRLLKEIFEYLGPLISVALIPLRFGLYALTGALEILLYVLTPLYDAFEWLANIIDDFADKILGDLIDWFIHAGGEIRNFIENSLMWVVDAFRWVGDGIVGVIDFLFGWIRDVINKIRNWFSWIGDVVDWLEDVVDSVTNWFATGGEVIAAASGGEVIRAQSGLEVQADEGGTLVMVAENGYNELMFNEGPEGDSFRERFASEVAGYAAAAVGNKFLAVLLNAIKESNMGGTGASASQGQNLVIQNILDGKVMSETVVKNINNKLYTINAGSIR